MAIFSFKIIIRFFVVLTTINNQALGQRLPNTDKDPYLRQMISELTAIKKEYQITDFNKTLIPKIGIPIASENELYQRLKYYAHYAGASYCVGRKLQKWSCFHCRRIGAEVEVINVFNDTLTGSRGFVAINKNKREIVLSFRGSANLRSFLFDFTFIPVSFKTGDGRITQVHQGFLFVSERLKYKYLTIMNSLIEQYPQFKITVTGHSLGGALATLASVELNKYTGTPFNQMFVYTYGEPVVGGPDFVNWLNKNNKNMIRVVNNNDIVPNINRPDDTFVHHEHEIFIKRSRFTFCKPPPNTYQDPNCLPKIGLSIIDHLTYFKTYIGIGC